MKKKISIIVPIYNSEKYLVKCVKSICNQTYKNIEIILVNDGSTDNSNELCDKLALQDERIIVIHQENKGQASARNAGLNICTGEYIGFVDSDDYIDEKMYEKMLEVALNENAEIVQIGHNVVNENYDTINTQIKNKKIYTNLDDCLVANIVNGEIVSSVCDKLFDYRILRDIRMEEGYYYEDGMVLLRLLKNANKVMILDDIGYFYVLSSNSTQRGPYNIKHIKSCIYEGNYFYNFLKQNCYSLAGYGIERCCFRAMRGFRFLYNNCENINKYDKNKFKKQLLDMFNENYLELKKNKHYKTLSLYRKIALKLFSISPVVYLQVFELRKKVR